MNELLTQYGLIYLLLLAFLTARPWISRKNVLFGVVFGSADIWKQDAARRIIRRFAIASFAAGVLLGGASLLAYRYFSPDDLGLSKLFAAAFFALFLFDAVPYILANRRMKTLKATLPNEHLVKGKIAVEIGGASPMEPISPAWFLLLLLPIAAAVIPVLLYYPGLPDRVATHFAQNGAADAWQTKSVGLVMGPVFNQIIVAAVIFLIGFLSRYAPASVKGSPQAAPGYHAFRKVMTLFAIAFALAVEAKFLMTELTYLGVLESPQTAAAVLTAVIVLLIVFLIAAFFRMARRKTASGAVLDDDDRWVLGMFYFNPRDPSLFVEKRNGIGRTLNFGRPATWIILIALILFIVLRKTLLK